MNQVRTFDDVVRVDLMSEPNLVPPKNWIDNLPNLLHLSRCSQRPTPSRYQRRLMAVQRQSWGGVHTITSLGILVEFSNDRNGLCFDPL